MHKMPKMPHSTWILRPKLYRWPPPFSTKVKWRSSLARQQKRRTQKSVVGVAVCNFFLTFGGKNKTLHKIFFDQSRSTVWDNHPKYIIWKCTVFPIHIWILAPKMSTIEIQIDSILDFWNKNWNVFYNLLKCSLRSPCCNMRLLLQFSTLYETVQLFLTFGGKT